MGNIVDDARTMIGAGNSNAAINILLKAVDSASDFSSQITMQAGKLKEITKKETLGIISFDDAMMARNQVNYALLEIIKELEPVLAKTNQPKVFISYNHADAFTANKIKDRLEKEGIAVTIDSEAMMPGENIQAFIEKCVRESNIVLSLVSKKSLLSAWVAMESINTFFQEKSADPKQFIPCYIEPDFFDQKFTGDAINEIDQRLNALNTIMEERIKQNLGIDDIDDERSRLLDLKHYIDKIVGRLRNSLCIDVRDENFETGIKKIIEKIKS